MKVRAIALSLSLAAGVPVSAGAQTAAEVDNQVTTVNHSTSNQGQTQVIGKISNDFSSFLGSDATAVVTGLRNGTSFSLSSTTTTTGAPVTNTTVITPPTGQMGFGNVYISLALAKQQLSTMGITEPTPEQLQAALTGGTITQTTGTGATATTTTTTLDGVLTMRSQGMGWGEIAQDLGFKLGPVMAGMKSANKNLTAAGTVTSAKAASGNKGGSTVSATGKGNTSSHGIVSGGGKAHGNAANAVTAGKSSGQGIVSAAGKGNGHAYGYSSRSSIVTGSGSAAGSRGGIVSAGPSSKGMSQGKGHNK